MKLPYSAKSVDFPFVYIYIYIFFQRTTYIYICTCVTKDHAFIFFVFIVHLKVKYNVTDIFKLHEIDPSRSPTLEFSKQKFRRIADYLYIYIATRSKQPMRATASANRSARSIHRCMHHAFTSPVGPFFHRIAATVPCDWLIAYIGSLSSHCHVWEAMHDSPEYICMHASLHRIAATVPWI